MADRKELLRSVLVWFGVLCGASALSLALLLGVAFGYDTYYANRVFPGVRAYGIRLDGLTRDEALRTLHGAVDGAMAGGFRFNTNARQIQLPLVNVATDDPDVTRDLLTYDVDHAIDLATTAGREGDFWSNNLTRLDLRVRGRDLKAPFALNEKAVEDTLRVELKAELQPALDAQLTVRVPDPKKAPETTVTEERDGHAFDFAAAIVDLRRAAERLRFDPITIRETVTRPGIRTADLEPLLADAPSLLMHAPFRLTAEDQSWLITSSTLASWIDAIRGPEGVQLTIGVERMATSLTPIIKDVLKPAKDGNLIVQDGRMTEFTAPVEGVSVDATATIASVYSGWAVGSSTIPLILTRTLPKITGDAEQLGIREILGVGRSNFSGSPANRRYNITLGAKRVNGSLVAPDQEFSLLKTLGPVDGAHGWLPELVIKGDKTTPEYGGGLCQIGTTTFRSALASGMPITERRNHSYRVRYYEPAGTDATIYEPSPDFRFKNDTGHWVLITTEKAGDSLAFTMWGTNDGRTVYQSKSRVYNIVGAPPKKIIETLDLPPGKTKCTEVAHAGADASFDYIVTNASGSSTKVTFNSHYRPWGAVCLLGVAQLSAPVPVEGAPVDQTGVNNPN